MEELIFSSAHSAADLAFLPSKLKVGRDLDKVKAVLMGIKRNSSMQIGVIRRNTKVSLDILLFINLLRHSYMCNHEISTQFIRFMRSGFNSMKQNRSWLTNTQQVGLLARALTVECCMSTWHWQLPLLTAVPPPQPPHQKKRTKLHGKKKETSRLEFTITEVSMLLWTMYYLLW